MLYVAFCEHDKAVAAIKAAHADESKMRLLALSSARVELRDQSNFDGACVICQARYSANGLVMGIEIS